MRGLTWWVQRSMLQMGWPGVAGVILLLIVACVQWIVFAKEIGRQDGLRTVSSALSSSLKSLQDQPSVPDEAALLARFYRALPLSTTAQRMDMLAKIGSAALAEGLVLEQASYLLNGAATDAFDGLDIVVPVKGSYLQLRRFMGRALADNPALALESVSFNRPSVADPAVDAQLRFTLYLQKP